MANRDKFLKPKLQEEREEKKVGEKMENNKEVEKQIASGITTWWISQGRFSEERIISKIHKLERMFLTLFLMQTAIFLLILFQL